MKVIHQTPNTLTMRHCSWQMWLFGLLGLGLGIACFVSWGQLSKLDCTRTLQQSSQGQCILTTSSWRGTKQQHWPLDEIIGVNVVYLSTQIHKTTSRKRYQIYLVTKQEQVALLNSSTNLNALQQQVEQIQEFLANTSSSHFVIQYDDRLFGVLTSILLMTGGGVIAIAGGTPITLRLNRLTGKLTLHQQSVFGTKHLGYPLNQITDVAVKYIGRYYTVVIVLGENQHHLPRFYSYSKGKKQSQFCAQKILEFLQNPDLQ